jgi:hypothetical protein
MSGQGPEIEWQKSLGGTAYEEARSIDQTSDGGYVVAGYSYSNDGDVSGNHGEEDYWIARLDSDGELIWQKSLGGSNIEFGYSIHQTADGGFIIAGNSDSNDGDVTGNHGDSDYWIVKLDSDGELIWQKSLGGTDLDGAASIQQTSDGGYIIAGLSYSNDGDVNGNHGNSDYWIVKLDSDGELNWQKSLGGTAGEEARSIWQTFDGGFIIAGDSNSNDGDVTGNHGEQDYWIVRLDSDGELIWQKSLGGTSAELATSVQQTADGGFITAGISFSNDGDVTENHGVFDYWIVRLDADGELIWQKSLGGTGPDIAFSLQQISDGGFIISGGSGSYDGDVTGNHGEQDYWIVKLDSDGESIWQKTLGGTSNEVATSIQQTSDGGFIIAGGSYSNDGDVMGNHGDSDYWILKLSSVVGLDEMEFKEFSIYPNPVSQSFTLSTELEAIGHSFVIVDQLGKVLLEGEITSTSLDFDASSFPSGTYYLLLQDGRNSIEIVKQ